MASGPATRCRWRVAALHVVFFIVAATASAPFQGFAAYAVRPPAWFAAEGLHMESTTSGSGCSLPTVLSTVDFPAFSANPPIEIPPSSGGWFGRCRLHFIRLRT